MENNDGLIASPWSPSAAHARMVLLIEIEPLSDKYSQIMLTKEQFSMLTSLMVHMFPAPDVTANKSSLPLNAMIIHMPPDIQNYDDTI